MFCINTECIATMLFTEIMVPPSPILSLSLSFSFRFRILFPFLFLQKRH